MKRNWLEHLGDPYMGGPLAVQAMFNEGEGHIIDGLLLNEDGLQYPIIRGVPVFVDNIGELFGGWLDQHREAIGNEIGEVPPV